MKQPKTIVRACNLLIRRVRYENAHLRMDESAPISQDDTEAIRSATKLYTETWIVPIIEMVRDGRVDKLRILS